MPKQAREKKPLKRNVLRIPSIEIGDAEIEVVYGRLRPFSTGHPQAGRWDGRRIFIDWRLTNYEALRTLVHESLHVMFQMLEPGVSKKKEELIVSRLEGYLIDWVRRNPELIEEIVRIP